MAEIERFVPVGPASLHADAPGWEGTSDENGNRSEGPTCWKCKGIGKRNGDHDCSVCQGSGRLPPKKRERESKMRPGEITQSRRNYHSWHDFGPLPYAVWASTDPSAVALWRKAQETKQSVSVPKDLLDDCTVPPVWLPRDGEQLCNLVGKWRILQCVGSHRWTTDDLVTAFVAAKHVEKMNKESMPSVFKYIDLGSGNGSVLSMTVWRICQLLHSKCEIIKCVGIEARSEAVALNRRSVAFNMGYPRDASKSAQPGVCPVHAKVLHGDFRQLGDMLTKSIWDDDEQPVGVGHGDADERAQFDLVTGTPPYFQVDFQVTHSKVEKAVINQGGMPTCQQSAPARCEFRGGIEAYCHAAALAMKPNGLFVVCENWINDARVHVGAKSAGLVITEVLPIQGSVLKQSPLFALYSMRKEGYARKMGLLGNLPKVLDVLPVRDDKGKWTVRYANEILEWMSIPAAHETDPRNQQT